MGIYFFIQAAEGFRAGDFQKKQEHTENLRHQQKFGLNYLYNNALNIRLLTEVMANPPGDTIVQRQIPRLRNKLALSLANILHWFKQRRAESFWGQTTNRHWLKPIETEMGLTEGRRGYFAGPNIFILHS